MSFAGTSIIRHPKKARLVLRLLLPESYLSFLLSFPSLSRSVCFLTCGAHRESSVVARKLPLSSPARGALTGPRWCRACGRGGSCAARRPSRPRGWRAPVDIAIASSISALLQACCHHCLPHPLTHPRTPTQPNTHAPTHSCTRAPIDPATHPMKRLLQARNLRLAARLALLVSLRLRDAAVLDLGVVVEDGRELLYDASSKHTIIHY